MKLCKDCRHVVVPQFFFVPIWSLAKCKLVSYLGANPVTGKNDFEIEITRSAAKFCENKRTLVDDACGLEGKLWEAKS